ncbi:MAG: GNAT family N-acetyltransferase [Rhodospirillales bacterium]|nr:GNAT family N-acetyltransferase [Rhodospirillales bacterium]
MIRNLSEYPDRQAALEAIAAIFFASTARTSFDSEDARQRFLETWTGYYTSHQPEDVLLWTGEDGAIGGYLTGCRDSAAAKELFGQIPGYDLFADLFPTFPAHLHVNCAAERRGGGIGSALVEAFAARCRLGLHIVTGPKARNVAFYQRLGFAHRVERPFRGFPLLFMGRRL